ncbi:hypothetical protein HPB47_022546 [Ixodes persulcatus]|uniref:Uncharacterized protein n=2 Tax=Ixodes persulcatus TaxID=34615 RepID=A0AC60Q9E1_IXOPE|nr:hypothetical protein HPB47_026635 [Ixodes persulcatus]KAG0430600.1 hypothetical protein HPB47_022546 [Ixodes persulcatus]
MGVSRRAMSGETEVAESHGGRRRRRRRKGREGGREEEGVLQRPTSRLVPKANAGEEEATNRAVGRQSDLQSSSKEVTVDGGWRKFVCEMCDYVATRRGNMRRHQKRDTGERPFCRHLCLLAFREMSLTIHLRTHTGERPFQCGPAGKRFWSAVN